MSSKYDEWIAANVPDEKAARNRCAQVTKAMEEAFPELTRVRGNYSCPYSGSHPHWWMFAVGVGIVDPTAMQFPSKGLGAYEPLDESQPMPTGKCMNCGEYCYNGDSACTEECLQDLKRYYGIK